MGSREYEDFGIWFTKKCTDWCFEEQKRQKKFAMALGISTGLLYPYLRGERKPTRPSVINSMAKLLGKEIYDILGVKIDDTKNIEFKDWLEIKYREWAVNQTDTVLQRDFANALGISNNILGRYLQGKAKPKKRAVLEKMANVLGNEAYQYVGGEAKHGK